MLDNTGAAAVPTTPATLHATPTEEEDADVIMLDQPTASRHSHRSQKRVTSPTRGVLRKTFTKRRAGKNRKVTFTNQADSDIEVLEKQPAVAQLTYPVRAMTDASSLARRLHQQQMRVWTIDGPSWLLSRRAISKDE
ncbi:hypothetical protein PMAYCL1PPCAC_19557 [Pristionchus mayeri]|uniref:Uncharacterized protein n=1 Tax=Pristionchus mayeri TaxID=1317129 RepID=A0AAN5I2B1_9BILA|nr:hypothetical protein PMAYCL1PPCAC_19557 [Pristionchus mayeri]